MLADVSRHILGRTEGRGLGFGQLVRTHTGKCLECQSSSDGHSTTMPCAQAEDSGLLGPLQAPDWVKVYWYPPFPFLQSTQPARGRFTPLVPHSRGGRCCLLVGCLTPQQHASVSQVRISSNNFTCCHTEIKAADQTFSSPSHSILTPDQPVPALTL